MFKLLRNKKVLRVVVIGVAIAFIGGFVGAAALQSQAGRQAEEASGQPAFNLEDTIAQLEEEAELYADKLEDPDASADDWVIYGNINYELARALSYGGRDIIPALEEAGRAYQKALDLDDERSNLYLSLAMVESSLEDYSSAEAHFQTFVDRYPDNFEGQALYAQMLAISGKVEAAQARLALAQPLAQGQEEEAVLDRLEEMIAEDENPETDSDVDPEVDPDTDDK